MTYKHEKRCSMSLEKCKPRPLWDITLYFHFHEVENSKRWWDMEKLETSHTAGGNIKWGACCGNSLACSSKCQNHHITVRFYSLGLYPRDMEMDIQILVHECSQQHYSQGPKCGCNPSVYQLMNRHGKCGPSHVQQNVILPLKVMKHWPATMWMDPENMMWGEGSHIQKVTYRLISFIENVQNDQIHTDRK